MSAWNRWSVVWVCGAALALSGCWGDGLNCATDGDCFLGEFCSSGRCAIDPDFDPTDGANNTPEPCPDEGTTRCGERCVDLSSDVLACGDCLTACTDGWVCRVGECVQPETDCRIDGCPEGQVCDPASVSCVTGCLNDDGCAPSQVCDGGQCTCGPGTHLCGDACVDSRSTDSCGDACDPCDGDPNGQAVCTEAGTCAIECAEGFLSCEGACSECPDGAGPFVCNGSQCTVSECADGELRCDGICVACPDDENATFTCEQSACVVDACAQGARLCDGACAKCPDGQAVATTTCAQDACVVESCVAGAAPCDQGCCVIVPAADGVVDAMAGRRPGVALTPGELPVAVYDTDSEVRVARYDGVGNWAISTVGTGRAGGPKSIDVDPSGGIHVIYFDDDDVMYASAPAGSGALTTHVLQTQQNADYGDLAIRIADNGSIAAAWSGLSEVHYAELGGASVTIEEAAGYIFAEPSGVDVGFLNDGSVRVTFTVNNEIHYARRLANGWDDQRLNRNIIDGIDATHTSLLVAPTGTPAIVFDSAGERAIEAFVFLGNGWQRDEVASPVTNRNNYQGFGHAVVDPTSTAHLAFIDFTSGSFEHGVSTGMSYRQSRVDAVTGNQTWRPGVDVDSGGTAHIVYPRVTGNTVSLYYKRSR